MTRPARGGKPLDEDLVELELRAGAGDVPAQLDPASRDAEGDGVAEDLGQTAYWFRRAVEQGHVDAWFNASLAYLLSHGLPRDRVQAAHGYRLAADQGDVAAQSNLGDLEQQGAGVLGGRVEALKWFLLAAPIGHALVARNADVLCATLTPADIDEAVARANEWRGDDPTELFWAGVVDNRDEIIWEDFQRINAQPDPAGALAADFKRDFLGAAEGAESVRRTFASLNGVNWKAICQRILAIEPAAN